MLHSKKRLKLSIPLARLRADTLRTGVSEVAVDGDIAILSTQLTMHADPADRLIVATALATASTLVTADDVLLSMRGGPPRIDATM